MLDIKTVKLKSEEEIIASWKNKEKIIVSVVCTTFNHEPYIEDAITGFLMQETDFAFEIIIHDDASTDATASIVRQYQKQYPNIIKPIFQTENQYSKGGFRPTLYTSSLSNGVYIALCEGDDFWISSNKLQIQAEYMLNNKDLQLTFHRALVVDEFRKLLSLSNVDFIPDQCVDTKSIIENWQIHTQTMMLRNNIDFVDVQNKFFGVVNMDWTLQLICSLKGKIRYIENVQAAYRKNPNSLSTVIGKDQIYRAVKLTALMDRFNVYSDFHFSKEVEDKKRLILNEMYENEFRRRNNIFTYIVANPSYAASKVVSKIRRILVNIC